MNLVVGFEDVKDRMAHAIESQRRIHFLLEGPPACAKSIMLEAVRSAVPGAFIVFGSRTSAAGLSEALFEHQPSVLLMDEADKMKSECYSVLLGLMESGEILETKSRRTRGIKLETMVIAACNSSIKFPPEFLSRFALHVNFPRYSREEFIEVCQGFLSRVENCPVDVAATIGTLVHDYGLGDVRKARGVWQLMMEPTEEEMHKVIRLMLKYPGDGNDSCKCCCPGLYHRGCPGDAGPALLERKREVKMKICPKCLATGFYSRQHCSECGTKVREVTFSCECGAELCPSFTHGFFPPWSRRLSIWHKHCPHCGRDVRNLVKDQVRELKQRAL